jgi:hypothetical protein
MKTTFPRIAILTMFASLLALGYSACNSGQKTEESTAQDTTAVAEPVATEETDSDSTTVVLPSPLQIATIFKKSGLTYLDGLTSDIASASKYSSQTKRSLNIGVYTTDLAYCVLNKQNQKALDYIKTVRTMGSQIGMGSIFDNNTFVERFQKNLSNEDSLAYVIADLQMETDMYLQNNDMTKLSPIMFCGAWLEALYLGSKVHEKKKSDNVSHKLTEQMIILDKIVALLKKNSEGDGEITGLLASLNEISAYYNSIPAVKAAMESEEQAGAKLTDEEVKKLSQMIVDARNKVVNG